MFDTESTAGSTEERSNGTADRRTFLSAVGTLTGVSVGTAAMSDAATAEDTNRNGSEGTESKRTPRITAHRGYADVYPENTVGAVEGASRLGADRIEIDIQPCAGGELVVFHDDSLGDLTDEEGRVAETPRETVLRAEVLESGETIPRLAEVLDAARPSVTMNIEFKSSGNYSWEAVADRALDVASEYPGDFYVSSFEPAALEAVREVDPTVPVAVLFGSDTEENLEIARELDAEAVNVSTGVLDRDLVETAHEEGRDVNVYTIDSWREARRPVELNVDGLIVDYPSVLAFASEKAD
ncbi:cytoplasmic glycerophosphodiester phosphodiesterase [Halalkalicoccus paucihalophilus]|uniref:Cytoplasmic glycerophosphodiester phosphodiesterase n=1 Tax=Halalkalicoccus paucihalophilus TaxID=1008153 RepID=A0A151AEU5_9EURY|nr:glycerophosphodiester phosphodiesterase [Halalkalicoccus paucihalophilus]KYH25907.1 cytoplasmic glycerophosphodiester phosphodiesterase [Halalkalicoccus paucihalophilus]